MLDKKDEIFLTSESHQNQNVGCNKPRLFKSYR